MDNKKIMGGGKADDTKEGRGLCRRGNTRRGGKEKIIDGEKDRKIMGGEKQMIPKRDRGGGMRGGGAGGKSVGARCLI